MSKLTEFKKYINTFAATYSGSVKTDVFFASVKNYKSSLEAGLFSAGVPEEVYRNLISSVRNSLPVLEEYISLHKKALNLPELEIYGYSTVLRSMTGGAGDFEYSFARYEQAPSDVQEREISARANNVESGED